MTIADPVRVDARKVAAAAAARSGVRIEVVHDLDHLLTVRDVIDRVWRPAPEDRPVTLGVLRAMTHAGNYCALAWDGADPIGVCVAFLGLGHELALHSHITGVMASAAGRNIGRAIKLDQRAWALEHGVDRATWTYDPLIRRNAFFNAARLGALPTEYLVDFYGDMTDAINLGQPTDRLSVAWRLADPAVAAICADRRAPTDPVPAGAALALDVDPADGEPIRPAHDDAARVRLVRVPADIESMRVDDPERARRWRVSVREVLGGLMSDRWQVSTVSRDGYYVLDRPEGSTT